MHQRHVEDGLASIFNAGRQTRSWVIGQGSEQAVHALDFGRLVVGDVRGELEQHGVVSGARLLH